MPGIGEPIGPGGFFPPVPVQRQGALTVQPGAVPAPIDVQTDESLRRARLDAARTRPQESDSRQQEAGQQSQEERDRRVFGRPSAPFLAQLIAQSVAQSGSQSVGGGERPTAREAAQAFTAAGGLATSEGADTVVSPNGPARRRLDISV